MSKIPIYISSIYKRESNFRSYRDQVKKIIEQTKIFSAQLSPEIKLSQHQFNKGLRSEACALFIIAGEESSKQVKDEIEIAIDRKDIPIILFAKTHPKMVKGKLDETRGKFAHSLVRLYDLGDNCKTFNTEKSLEKIVIDSLEEISLEKFGSSFKILNYGKATYKNIAELIKENKPSKIILCQKTSSLILGPRRIKEEEDFYNELVKWIKKIGDSRNQRFIHIFSIPETSKEMKYKSADYLLKTDFLNDLFKIRRVKPDKIQIYGIDFGLPKLIIIDCHIGFTFYIKAKKIYSIFTPNTGTREIIENIEKDIFEIIESKGIKPIIFLKDLQNKLF